MKTAIELADRLRDLTSKTKCPSYERGIMNGAIEMLRQQAEQLSAWLAANGPGGWIDDLRNKCEALEITNDALKADAERIDWLSEKAHLRFGVSLDYAKYAENGLVLENGYRVTYFHNQGNRQPTLRAAIDAMKGKS